MSASVQSMIDYGNDGLLVDIECHLSNNLPNIVIVGFTNRAVDEARERVRGAFMTSGLVLPRKRITINLAPADIPKDGSSFDLAIAAAIIMASSASHAGSSKLSRHDAVMGELALDGTVRPVRGVIGKILAGRRRGIDTFYIPHANLPQARLIPGVTLVPLSALSELSAYLSGNGEIERLHTGSGMTADVQDTVRTGPPDASGSLTLGDIIGQEQAKRALEIAAAGGHNILLSGPPGTGKSMLAHALPAIMPELSREEMLEVTHLHSLASKEYDGLVAVRPFRAPHHSASHVAIVGGGTVLRPGEISLSHHGVLLFDEFPEFNRQTIEALRQPLEDRRITIARARDRVEFPANFILVATANPCPCGYYGVPNPLALATRICQCSPAAVQRYRAKLSGPILDRIDLYSEVHEVEHANLLAQDATGETESIDSNDAVRARVQRAREKQMERFGGPQLNAAMTNRDIKRFACLAAAAKDLLDTAGRSLDMSARAYLRTVKVARTIADLGASETIEPVHVSEALQYRSRMPAL